MVERRRSRENLKYLLIKIKLKVVGCEDMHLINVLRTNHLQGSVGMVTNCRIS
jgi:hypothetical protein